MQTGAGGAPHVLVAVAQTSPYSHSPAIVVTQPWPLATFALHVEGVVLVSQ
jgi:hypothetical protein